MFVLVIDVFYYTCRLNFKTFDGIATYDFIIFPTYLTLMFTIIAIIISIDSNALLLISSTYSRKIHLLLCTKF